jgi:diguanylate cyclase (GGDEF)-like protein
MRSSQLQPILPTVMVSFLFVACWVSLSGVLFTAFLGGLFGSGQTAARTAWILAAFTGLRLHWFNFRKWSEARQNQNLFEYLERRLEQEAACAVEADFCREIFTGINDVITANDIGKGEPQSLNWLCQDRKGNPVRVEVSLKRVHVGGRDCAPARNLSESEQRGERLACPSRRDFLTGLYSRSFFVHEMTLLQNRRCPLGIIVCDIDGLKIVNDTLGHHKGDSLLVLAADLLKRSCRQNDVIARVGGDEFAVLLPGADAATVDRASRELERAVCRYNEQHAELPLSISLGAVSGTDRSVYELYKEADNRMHRVKLHRIRSNRSEVVQALMKTLEVRDSITDGHTARMKNMVTEFAGVLGLPEPEITDLRLLTQFHDIGKVGIPDSILLKPGPLTPEERDVMQKHCEIGQRITLSAPCLAHISDWVLKHHEWWNGKGYPLGLKEEEIPFECRLLAIVDAYESMTGNRPYRGALAPEEAVAELRRCSGTQFDPCLVPEFIFYLTKI